MQPPPTTLSFAGHETFPFRYAWLKKGVDRVADDAALFRRDDAMTRLGVGKNMVRSIRHWCLAAGVIEELPGPSSRPSGCFKPSPFGQAVFGDGGLDPYLEDPATLWLLHWQVVTGGQRCTTWLWAFNYFHEPEFTREALYAALLAWAQAAGARRLAASSLRRDVDCFLRTYVPSRQTRTFALEDTLDCPLVELGLVRTTADRQAFRFARGPQPHLPDGVLFYAAVDFWQRRAAGVETLALRDLARQPGGPGQVFKIDEGALAERCGRIERWTDGAISYDETAGLRQLYRRRPVDLPDLLRRAYAPAAGAEGRRRWGA